MAIPRSSQQLEILGTARVERDRRPGFPAYHLVVENEAVASMGRYGWLRIFFGRGQRIVVENGVEWRLRSAPYASQVAPMVMAPDGKLAIATSERKTYLINGKDYAYVMTPAESNRIGRARNWMLRRHEDEVGVLSRRPVELFAAQPLPLPVALLSLLLVRFGIPGEGHLGVPQFRWR